MSYIFEALQRAEAERAGGNLPKNTDSVTELLQGVEQEIARKLAQTERTAEGLPKNTPSAAELLQEIQQGFASRGPVAAPPAAELPVVEAVEHVQAVQKAALLPEAALLPAVEPARVEPQEVQRLAVERTEVERAPVERPVVERPRVERQRVERPRVEPAKIEPQRVAPQRIEQPKTEAPKRIERPSIAETRVVETVQASAVPEIEYESLISEEPAAQTMAPDAGSFADAKVISSGRATDPRLVCLNDQGGLAAEKFRVLGLKLRHLRDKRKLKRIVVTGTSPEEGKSLVAANLALNQSRSKVLKTLLIDGDLRRPTVATRFGFDSSVPGLSECLRGERRLSEVVYRINGSSLFLLPAGRAPENPLDLMQGGRLPELLEELGRFFDWIIIDTPPVVPVADTTFWMKQADGVLVVIREGVSEKKVVERALDSFDKSTLLGVVVNSCSSSDHKDYYSRYSRPPGEAGESVSPATGYKKA